MWELITSDGLKKRPSSIATNKCWQLFWHMKVIFFQQKLVPHAVLQIMQKYMRWITCTKNKKTLSLFLYPLITPYIHIIELHANFLSIHTMIFFIFLQTFYQFFPAIPFNSSFWIPQPISIYTKSILFPFQSYVHKSLELIILYICFLPFPFTNKFTSSFTFLYLSQ